MTVAKVKPVFFATATPFRAWLKKHYATAEELLVGFYKRDSGMPSMTWPESVDQALCYGWIDGHRRRIDDLAYSIRFTPRRATSTWSVVNVKRVAELTKDGLMQPAGLKAFALRDENKVGNYSYERRHDVTLESRHKKLIKANKKAWAYFQKLAPSYQYLAMYFIVNAKREETKLKRIDALVRAWSEGQRGF